MLFGMIAAVVVVGIIGFVVYGTVRWSRTTEELMHRLQVSEDSPGTGSSGNAATPVVSLEKELAELPAPVQRYLRRVLTDGQPVIQGVHMRHSGTFNMGQADEQWKPFTAEQTVNPLHPGFLWDARIRMLPILPAYVHDAYIDGGGLLHGALFGAVTVMEVRETPEIAHGEFLRFLAEAPWYPTALLPSQGAHWEAVDDSAAHVTLTDASASGATVSARMLFRFNDDNVIESVYAEERGAEIDGKMVPTPWEGRWWSYEQRDGMLVPTEGEVAWLFPEHYKPYWRGRVEEIRYDFAAAQ